MSRMSVAKLFVGTAIAAVSVAYASSAYAQTTEPVRDPTAPAPAASAPSADGKLAADQESVSGDQSSGPDIVVTGTLIRGIAPTGTNVVGLSSEDVVASGAPSANQLLARVPQVTSAFNQVPTITPGAGSGISVIRPNLRNLGAAGGSTTLVLVDGHRVVSAGALTTSPDPDIVPPSLIERVDVIPDGGSSIYGSDAVGGVINFITRKKFDGVEASARYGFADNYTSVDANLTVGKDWGSGSIFVAYAYAYNSSIFGRDRGYFRQTAANSGNCAPGTITVTRGGVATNYALPGRVPGTMSQCDYTDDSSVIPEQRRHSVFAGFSQQLNSAIAVDVRAFYTRRDTVGSVDLNYTSSSNTFSGTVTPSNPYYVPIAPDPGSQTVAGSFAGVFSPRSPQILDELGVNPSITADLGGGWQLRALGGFGRSVTVGMNDVADAGAVAAALAGTTTATALNPYDVGASDPAVLASIRRQFYARGEQELFNGRAILDGTLFNLPGGGVKLAVGSEITYETLQSNFGAVVPGQYTSAPSANGDRTVKSVFGELVVPVFGGDNAFGGMYSLRLSASGRYDHYSDFGGTFNPKFGATWQPVEWLSIRGNWGKSFNAPSIADRISADTRIVVLPVSPFLDPADSPANFFRPTLALAGGNANLKPQKANTWSVGADVKPHFIPGLSLSGTYYNIYLQDQIAIIPFTTAGTGLFTPTYSNFIFKNPTLAFVNSKAPGYAVDGAASLAAVYAAGSPYLLLDLRRNNLGIVKQDGIDFNLNYNHATSFGAINAGFAGTYTLNRMIAAIPGAPFTNDLESPGSSRFSFTASLGGTVGKLTALATLNHTAGYDLNPAQTSTLFPTQTHVGDFNTIDLFFQYDLKGAGILRDMALTLNVSNLLDQDPPFYASGNGYANGSTIGRYFQFGIRKKF